MPPAPDAAVVAPPPDAAPVATNEPDAAATGTPPRRDAAAPPPDPAPDPEEPDAAAVGPIGVDSPPPGGRTRRPGARSGCAVASGDEPGAWGLGLCAVALALAARRDASRRRRRF
jgi:hypothetical protein